MATPHTFTTRQMILRLVGQDPAVSQAKLARMIGISQQRVSQILAEEGYTVGLVKVPTPRGRKAPPPQPEESAE